MHNIKCKKINKKITPYIFISPFIILFLVFMVYPMVYSFFVSLNKWDGISEKTFIGLQNYMVLFQDDIFIRSLGNSMIIFLMYVPLMLFLSLLFAVLLNNPTQKLRGFFRTAIFIPNITSLVAVAFVFILIFDKHYGLINSLLSYINIEPISWLGGKWTARIVISILLIWRWVGYNMILLLGGLQNISKSIFEAAKIDGAKPRQIFFKIILPLMRPILLFCVITSTIGTFKLFAEPMLMTGGGPNYATMSPILYMYDVAFGQFNLGYASSITYVFILIMIILAGFEFFINEKIAK